MVVKNAHNVADLRAQARAVLPRAIFEFVDRGTEDEHLLAGNLSALARIKLAPRTLRDVAQRDMSVELFGRRQPLPMVIAPTGIADLMCHRGESAIANAATKAGLPFSLATSSTTSIETIGKIAAPTGFWMQMYLWERRDLSWQVVDRAAAAGAEVLILTVDTPVWPLREFNKRNGMSNPIRPNPRLALDFALHPRWSLGTLGRYMVQGGVPQFANYPREIGGKITGTVSRMANSASVCWTDVAELRKRWTGKLVLKGILHPEDAKLAREHGADGIAVSNHGGRNFDSSPAAIDVLPGIVDAVGKDLTVLFDSGVRRGADVLKALAIGAKAVLIGRPTLYGAAAGGEAGAARAIELLSNEIDLAMAMLGITSLGELDRSYLLPGTLPGSGG